MILTGCITGLNLSGFLLFNCRSSHLLSTGFSTGRIVGGYSVSSAGYMAQKGHIVKKVSCLDMMKRSSASEGIVTIGDTGSTLVILNQLRISYVWTSVFQYLLIRKISSLLRRLPTAIRLVCMSVEEII